MTFTALVKKFSMNFFCNTKVAGLGKIFIQCKFPCIQQGHTYMYLMCCCSNIDEIELGSIGQEKNKSINFIDHTYLGDDKLRIQAAGTSGRQPNGSNVQQCMRTMYDTHSSFFYKSRNDWVGRVVQATTNQIGIERLRVMSSPIACPQTPILSHGKIVSQYECAPHMSHSHSSRISA